MSAKEKSLVGALRKKEFPFKQKSRLSVVAELAGASTSTSGQSMIPKFRSLYADVLATSAVSRQYHAMTFWGNIPVGQGSYLLLQGAMPGSYDENASLKSQNRNVREVDSETYEISERRYMCRPHRP